MAMGIGDGISIVQLLSQVWSHFNEATPITIDPLSAIDGEPEYQRLREEGWEMYWARATRLRQCQRDGWQPVEFREDGRKHFFVDRVQELILLKRKGQER